MSTEQQAPQQFLEYMERNYRGEVFFSDPAWHANRIWRAALSAQPVAQQEQPMIPFSALRPIAVEAIRNVIGCPDVSSGGLHLTDELERIARAAIDTFAQQATELDPLTLCECGDQFTAHDKGVCVNCLAAMPKVRDEQAPEQEPVAWRYDWIRHDGSADWPPVYRENNHTNLLGYSAPIPLYLHPEQDAKDAALTRDELARLLPKPDGTAYANREIVEINGFTAMEFSGVPAWSKGLVLDAMQAAIKAGGSND